jgi:hypothetical protein
MENSSAITEVTSGMRWILRIAGILVLIAGYQLFVLTSQTDRYFAWTINPPLTAAFLGASYWASFVLVFLASQERYWANARAASFSAFTHPPWWCTMRISGPALNGTTVDMTRCTKDGRKPAHCQCMPGAGLNPAAYWGKPVVRKDRGEVGIIRSPVRASVLPDCGGRGVTRVPRSFSYALSIANDGKGFPFLVL